MNDSPKLLYVIYETKTKYTQDKGSVLEDAYLEN